MLFPLRFATVVTALSLSSMAGAQGYDDFPAAVGDCRAILVQVDIDGVSQPVAARACLQPDGSWQIVRNDDDSGVIVNPAAAYPYPDLGYAGPPIFVGIGTSFVFVDRFHHFHHFHHMGHPHFGGFHPNGAPPHGGFHGGMNGFGGGHHR